MNKINLNMQVVSMRKFVKQARTRAINHLSRQTEMLKNKKGSEEQVAKNMKKSERLILEITALKKLKVDDVSKFALTNKESFETVAKSSDMELKCKTRLATHDSVLKAVDDFRRRYVNWETEIPTLLEMWQIKIEANAGKGKKEKGTKPQKRKKKSVNDIPLGTKSDDAVTEEPVKAGISSEKVPQNYKGSSLETDTEPDDNIELKEPKPKDIPFKKQQGQTVAPSESSLKTKMKPVFKPSSVTSCPSAEIRQLKMEDLEGDGELVFSEEPDRPKSVLQVPAKKRSSFFLNYVGGVASESENEDIKDSDEESDSNRKPGKFEKSGGFRGREKRGRFDRGQSRHRGESNRGRFDRGQSSSRSEFKRGGLNRGQPRSNRGSFGRARGGKDSSNFAPLGNNVSGGRGERSFKGDSSGFQKKALSEGSAKPATSETLHPSWLAKRKEKEQSNQIQMFKGQKTTFD